MRILVTGGAGFIGRHLANTLSAEGHEIFIADTGSAKLQERVDIRDESALEELFNRARPELVYHLAAIASVPHCQIDPVLAFSTNVIGTTHVGRLARKYGARVVFTSSAAVYPSPRDHPSEVSTAPGPENLYGLSKLAGERILSDLDPRVSILRLFNVYGPDCQRSYVIPDAVRKFRAAGRAASFDGHGTEERDFVYVEDVVRALILAGLENAPGTYNVGTGVRTNIRTIVEEVRRIMSRAEVEITFTQPRPGDYRANWAALGSGNTILDWMPKTSLEEGLRATVLDLLHESTVPVGVSVPSAPVLPTVSPTSVGS